MSHSESLLSSGSLPATATAPRFAARRALRLAVVAAFSLAVACSGDGAGPPSVTVTDSAGIRLVTSTGSGPAEAPGWQVVPDLRIGEMDGPHSFGRISDVAPRRAGGLWVVDARALRVRGFDERGEEVLAFGGPGQGPGEFRSVGGISESVDGILSVGGRMPIELYRFDPSGVPLETATPRQASYRDLRGGPGESQPPLGPTMGEWRFAADGSAFVQAVTLDAPAGDMVRTDVLLRLETDARPAVRFARWESEAMRGGPGGRMRMLEPAASWSPRSDGGVWFTPGDRYELLSYGPDGELRTIVRRPVGRTALTEDLERTFTASLAAETDAPGALAMLERAVFPDSLPATSGLWVSEPEGRLWVGVMDPDLPPRLDEPNAWDVFAPDGTYLGRLPIPEGLRPTRVTGDYIYGVWLDELEVPHARRYRIERAE